jgi:elongation factor G
MLNRDMFPVFCVSALKGKGADCLMGFIGNATRAAAEEAAALKPLQTIDCALIKPERNADTSLFFIQKYIPTKFRADYLL